MTAVERGGCHGRAERQQRPASADDRASWTEERTPCWQYCHRAEPQLVTFTPLETWDNNWIYAPTCFVKFLKIPAITHRVSACFLSPVLLGFQFHACGTLDVLSWAGTSVNSFHVLF